MVSTADAVTPTPAAPRSRVRQVNIGPGWLACLVVLGASMWAVHWYGVAAVQAVAFTAYTLLAGTLPGTLLYRLMMRRPGHIGIDASAGTAVGFAVEIPVYLLARALDAPLAVLAWPVATLALFVAVPSLRRHWRGSGERMPAGVSWALAVFALYLLVGSAFNVWRIQPLSGALANAPYVDMPFQIALVAELKHHFPATMPYVTATPLQYHWYVHAHAAAASWVTGIEPQVLMLRLVPLPMLYMAPMLFVGIARALTRRWWPGLLMLAISAFAYTITPTTWGVGLPNGSILSSGWFSPTQTFGAALFAALVLVLVELLRGTAASGPGPWIALALLAGAVAGAKATFLPMLACGLALAIVVRLLTRRRPDRVLLGTLGITVVWLVFAQLGLYGGGDQGLVLSPLNILRTASATPLTATVTGFLPQHVPAQILLVLLVLTLATWLPGLFGSVGGLRRELRTDAAYVTVAGVGIAGAGGLFVFGHPGLSELYFIRSGEPYLALVAACGFAALLPGLDKRRVFLLGLAAAALGVGTAYLVRNTSGATVPAHGMWPALRPYALLFGILVVLAAGVMVAARLTRQHWRAGLVAITIMAFGVVVPFAISQPQHYVSIAESGKLAKVRVLSDLIPAGGIEAARWLRDHSSPDDLVATNEHCLPLPGPVCDSRSFWVAAFTERRVLIEGWAYTDRASEATPLYGDQLGKTPYWDPGLLATNDAVFTTPNATTVNSFAQQYHVRWLVAVAPDAVAALAQFATLRYTAGRVSIYQLNG